MAAEEKENPPERPFVAASAALDLGAPGRWLRLGWQDLRRAPGLTLVFGGVIVLVSMAVSWLGWLLGRFALLATLLSGFVFVAPLICVGLYCVSRALAQGREPRLADSFVLARRVAGQAAIFALGQGVIILLWARAGMVIAALSPTVAGDRTALLEYLAIGSIVGGIFAALTFAVAVVSLPFVADREVDMITACLSSVNAVLRNKAVMALWAGLILLFTVIGFASVFLGLAIIMPWLAYASWHAYRETLQVEPWPPLP